MTATSWPTNDTVFDNDDNANGSNNPVDQIGDAHDPAAADRLALIPDVPAPAEARVADPSLNGGKREVVFINTSLQNYQTLVDGGRDGLAQMAKWAETHSGYDAIHVLSHGSEGSFRVGTNTVVRLPKRRWPGSVRR